MGIFRIDGKKSARISGSLILSLVLVTALGSREHQSAASSRRERLIIKSSFDKAICLASFAASVKSVGEKSTCCVDDSAVARELLVRILASDPEIHVPPSLRMESRRWRDSRS